MCVWCAWRGLHHRTRADDLAALVMSWVVPPLRRRWRVQAFMLPDWTGRSEDIPFAPSFYLTRRGAEAQVRRLGMSMAPGLGRVEVHPPGTHDALL